MFSTRIAKVLAIGSLVTGCYSLQPVTGTRPEAGKRVAFDVTDAGRVALSGSMGPEIGQIEGRLLTSENGDFVVAVSGIRFVRGGEQIWTGERVSIKPEYVGRTYERRFAPGRTIALSAALGATALILFGKDLIGLGREERPRPGRDPDPVDLISRRP